MTDYDKLRELAQNADDKNSLEWFKSGDLMIRRFEYADAEFIAAAGPAVVLNLLEDLRITRQERDAEKKKRMVEAKEHALPEGARTMPDGSIRLGNRDYLKRKDTK